MRSSPLTLCLLSLVSVVSGCSQTGALRSSNTSEMKTIASVGDKPLPIVAGEPGASLRPSLKTSIGPSRRARGSRAEFMTNGESPCPTRRFALPSAGQEGEGGCCDDGSIGGVQSSWSAIWHVIYGHRGIRG